MMGRRVSRRLLRRVVVVVVIGVFNIEKWSDESVFDSF